MTPALAYVLILLACAAYWGVLRLILDRKPEPPAARAGFCLDCGETCYGRICENCLERRR